MEYVGQLDEVIEAERWMLGVVAKLGARMGEGQRHGRRDNGTGGGGKGKGGR